MCYGISKKIQLHDVNVPFMHTFHNIHTCIHTYIQTCMHNCVLRSITKLLYVITYGVLKDSLTKHVKPPNEHRECKQYNIFCNKYLTCVVGMAATSRVELLMVAGVAEAADDPVAL